MKTAAVAGVCLLAGIAWGGQAAARKPSTFTDETYRFTIPAPAFPKAKSGDSVVPVVMFAPAESDHTPNVQVTVHQVALKLEEYRRAQLDQVKRAGWKVNAETKVKVSGREAILFDYEGPHQGRELRWLALALVDRDRAFLVTAAALKAGFAKVEKEFRTCLEGFKLAD